MATVIRGSDNFDTSDNATQTELDALSTGKVLQVVNVNNSTNASTNTVDSWTDTSISASITPSSTSSKIFIIASVAYGMNANGYSDIQGNIGLKRGSTVVYGGLNYDDIRNYYNGGGYRIQYGRHPIAYLDSPSTTSSTTYKVVISAKLSGTNFIVNGSNTSQITLMEIAA